MADTKISGLTADTAPDKTDIFPFVDDVGGSPVTKYTTGANMTKALDPSALSALTTIDSAADYMMIFDATDSSFKKMLVKYVRGTSGDLWLSAGGGKPTTSSPCASSTTYEHGTNDVDMTCLDFDQTSVEYAYWNVRMPSDWDAGTVTATFYWMHTGGSAFKVMWGLQGRAYANDDAGDAAYGTIQEITDTGGTAGDIYISSATPAITIAGTPAAGQYVTFRARRDPTDGDDTLDSDARLLGIYVAYGRT